MRWNGGAVTGIKQRRKSEEMPCKAKEELVLARKSNGKDTHREAMERLGTVTISNGMEPQKMAKLWIRKVQRGMV